MARRTVRPPRHSRQNNSNNVQQYSSELPNSNGSMINGRPSCPPGTHRMPDGTCMEGEYHVNTHGRLPEPTLRAGKRRHRRRRKVRPPKHGS